jgi:hypothetical protein
LFALKSGKKGLRIYTCQLVTSYVFHFQTSATVSPAKQVDGCAALLADTGGYANGGSYLFPGQ